MPACFGEGVFVYEQREDGLNMKAPIEHSVRVRVDTSTHSVEWLQDVVDSRGTADRRFESYGDSSGSPCTIYDDRNWRCELRGVDGALLVAPEMKDGSLSRFYWGTTERYAKRRRIGRFTF